MFACIYISDFPVEAIVRAEPLLREQAVAVLEGKAPLLRIVALNDKARQLGMEIGMTKLQAAVFAENLAADHDAQQRKPPAQAKQVRHSNFSSALSGLAILRQRSVQQEASAHSALLDVAHASSPRVEDTAPDTLLVDLVGMERLYGAPAKMARDLAARVSAVGIEANIALAANPDAAMHAARGFKGITIISAGEEAQRLGVLPLQVLLEAFDISPEKRKGRASSRDRDKLREQMLDILERWGVRDFRTLALLPEHALASRLGEAGARLQRLARGAVMRTLVLCEPLSRFEEVMELETSVETIESLSFVLNRLLEQLCARLESRALAAQELSLRLQLEHRVADEETTTVQESPNYSHNVGLPAVYERTLQLPVSMRDSKVFLKLLQLELAAHPPGAPVTKIWITAEPAPPRSAQRGLFLPVTPEAEKLEITLARISGIVGERRAGIARLIDTHRPNRFQLDRFVVLKNPLECPTTWDAGNVSPLALRMFRPPRRLKMRLLEGRPVSLAAETTTINCGELWGKIVWSAGPWRSSGDWWTENAKETDPDQSQSGPWDREEWDIALAYKHAGNVTSGSMRDTANPCDARVFLYRIYRDVATGHWFADASYD